MISDSLLCSSNSGFLESNQQVTVESTGQTLKSSASEFLGRESAPGSEDLSSGQSGLGVRVPKDGGATDGSW